MKIAQKQESSFLNKDFRRYKAILVFGSDHSLVSERVAFLCRKVITNKDSETFSKVQLNYSDVAKDPSHLIDHIFSNTLLAEPKFIIIEDVDTSINKEVKAILVNNKSDNIVVLKAGELPPNSSIRRFFELENDLAALPCYTLENIGIKELLLTRMSEHQIKCEHGVVDYVVSNLRGEYLAISSEIDKMILCGIKQGTLSISNVEELLSGSSEKNTYDRLIKFLINADAVAVEHEFLKLNSSGVHVIAISRNIANYFIRLLRVKELISYKICSESEALNILRPPIFFKHLEDFKRALNKYSIVQIINIIEICTNLEIECKTTNISPLLCWEKMIYRTFLYKPQQFI
jgi:DNA polymerase III subunit delta